MRLSLQQTHHVIGNFSQIYRDIEHLYSEAHGIHVFPELFLTGYPLQDLCLMRPFIESYHGLLEKLEKLAKSGTQEKLFLMGGLEYELDSDLVPLRIYNAIYAMDPQEGLRVVYRKKLLPNYDIFDEKKYFHPGDLSGLFQWNGYQLGLLVCEDMWASSFHKLDPAAELLADAHQKNLKIDALINLSASPFYMAKVGERIKRARELSETFNAPFIYVNRVGGEDEILFDGHSFAIDQNREVQELKSFAPDTLEIELSKNDQSPAQEFSGKISHTWESLFAPQLDESNPVKLKQYSDAELEELVAAIGFGVQEYATKSGFNKFLVALSGGIDSTVVLTLLKLSLKEGQSLEAIYMPGQYSANLSWEGSLELCQKLGVPLANMPIKFLHATGRRMFEEQFDALEGLADENIQSRLRGLLLYTRSNQTGAMVLNTSNKSELAVGYSTQYGDSVGALSLLGDLYKSEVYQLARYINKTRGELIPEKIIQRAPSAELRENQKDQDSLPSYEVLDAILEGILSYRMGPAQLIERGHDEDQVKKVFDLYQKAEYKRYQFCPILKLKTKSFGFGYRIPLCKKWELI